MKTTKLIVTRLILGVLTCSLLVACSGNSETDTTTPSYKLIPAKKVLFNSFVDCNMAEAWVGDTFRIFPGKYGEDPLWGNARDLKYADGRHAEEAFASKASDFTEPNMPANVSVNTPGLHGAVWFETVYQDPADKSGKTLYAVYHNENYPATLPYDAATEEGYKNEKWPQGITGPTSPAAVCRIGIMKSVNGGKSWENKGIFIEDLQPRMILKPHNTSKTFAGGVGDPSAVASGAYLYLFYGEYGYPGQYSEKEYNPQKEWSGQCISVARIPLADLDNPVGKAQRWNGKGFNAPYNGVGAPITSLQIQPEAGGGPASSPTGNFHWGPSVSWNTYLNCWVMLMGKATGPSWAGSSIHISFNTNPDLGEAMQSQAWTKPKLLLDKPGYFLWYPSLQPMNTPDDLANKHTCLRLGQRARLFVKNIQPKKSEYMSEYMIEFVKPN
ncbi:hypothetical protein EXU85_34825 [Spirosoma sp. KCTC 42546]|uniref:hypothetical protein n=1 Tax=Spirosoma sp. KCTC 42546 TaxID=2520506 RepID=UPI001159B47C|nr:hypothetical protein [Spirosoma sp. KCTC 42546]QDK83498.1 hypothetical protein EXU85_34825 [Spirosoma sp. KCTC 42546]